jgi:hypothetical protein
VFLQHEHRMWRADLFHFRLQRSRNIARRFVSDDGDSLLWFKPETIANSVPRSWLKFRVQGYGVVAVGHGLRSGQLYAKIEVEEMHDRQD